MHLVEIHRGSTISPCYTGSRVVDTERPVPTSAVFFSVSEPPPLQCSPSIYPGARACSRPLFEVRKETNRLCQEHLPLIVAKFRCTMEKMRTVPSLFPLDPLSNVRAESNQARHLLPE